MKQTVSLSDSEWIIMQEIWKRGEATFREICDGVADREWSKPAVAAFLKRMEAKGAIVSEDARPVKRYRPLLKKETAVRRGAAVSYLIADKNVEILPDRTLMGHSSYPIVLAKGSQV